MRSIRARFPALSTRSTDVVQTVHQNRGNVDLTLKNFAELSAKLNNSADKVDGVLTSAQSFLGSPGTKGAVDRISEAAESVKKLADDVDARVKEIAVGLSRFSNSGLREYEALAIEGRRAIDDIDRTVRSLERNPNQLIFGSKPVAARISWRPIMGRLGGRILGSIEIGGGVTFALTLAACASGAPTMFDLAAAKPPPARGLRGQIRIGQPTATADLDSDRILVRDIPLMLATLAGARWSEALPALFRTRLAQSFQNAGLAHSIDGPAANADYEVDLDIRAFEFDAADEAKSHVDVAAWIVSLGTGRIVADQIFTLRAPVASTGAADVAAAQTRRLRPS